MMNPVHHLRIAAGRTQQDLATLAGTSQSAIVAYEGENKSPTWCTVERLAQAAGLEIDLRFIPPLTREERRSLLLHEAVSARLREEPEAVLVRARACCSTTGSASCVARSRPCCLCSPIACHGHANSGT